MSEKLGVENIIRILDVVIEAGNVGGEIAIIAKDPLAGIVDKLKPASKILDEVYALFKTDFKAVIPEYKDIDSVELAQIYEHFRIKFDIPQDRVEEIVERAFAVLLRLEEDIKAVFALVAAIKGLNAPAPVAE